MDHSLHSLLNTPHFTEEIRGFTFERAKEMNYEFSSLIPGNNFIECLGILKGTLKGTVHKSNKKDSENEISYAMDTNVSSEYFARKLLERIFAALDLKQVYILNYTSNTSPIYLDISKNLGLFKGRDLEIEKDSNLYQTPSFILCKEQYNKKMDLMFLVLFCMSIENLSILLKKNLSYTEFIKVLIEKKELEKKSVFTV